MLTLLLLSVVSQCGGGACSPRAAIVARPAPVVYQAPAVAVVRRPVVVHERRGLFRGRKAILAKRGCR